MRSLKMFFAALLAAVPLSMYLAKAPDASACSCARLLSLSEAAGLADVAFAGTVTSIEDPGAGKIIQSSADPLHISFVVERIWKGDVGPDAVVSTAKSSASCGYPGFEAGKTYVVFAAADGERLTTGLCSGTVPLDDTEEAVAELGEGTTVERPDGAEGNEQGAAAVLEGPPETDSLAAPIGGTAAVAVPNGGAAAGNAASLPLAVTAALAGTAALLAGLAGWVLYRNRRG